MTRFFFSVWQLRVSWCGAPSLMRGWVCNLLLQLFLSLARAVGLGSKSCTTRYPRDHILCLIETPQPRGPGPHICISQEQGDPIIPQGTGFPFRHLLLVAGLRWRSYDMGFNPNTQRHYRCVDGLKPTSYDITRVTGCKHPRYGGGILTLLHTTCYLTMLFQLREYFTVLTRRYWDESRKIYKDSRSRLLMCAQYVCS
jgi:hypothetical protein